MYYRLMQNEELKSINNMVKKSNKVLLVVDFNSKEINWGEMEERGDTSSRSEELLTTMTMNTMDQWVKETRYREDRLSQLDFFIYKKAGN